MVTTTPERAGHILDAQRAATQGHGAGLFLFTDHGKWHYSPKPLGDSMFLTGNGDITALTV